MLVILNWNNFIEFSLSYHISISYLANKLLGLYKDYQRRIQQRITLRNLFFITIKKASNNDTKYDIDLEGSLFNVYYSYFRLR